MPRRLMLFSCLAFALVSAAPPAHAAAFHWQYINPGSCTVIGGMAGVAAPGPGTTTGALILQAPASAVCQIRLPQGATITAMRTYGLFNGPSGFSVLSTWYGNPERPGAVNWFADAATNTLASSWVVSPSMSVAIDNENYAYTLIVSPVQRYVTNWYDLIEVTYITPT